MIDLDKMKLIYKLAKDLKLKDLQVVLNAAHKVSHNKKEIIIEAGTVRRDVFYLTEGLVRAYYVDDTGKETTFGLIKENQLVFDLRAILESERCKFNFEVVEPIKAYKIDYNLVDDLVAKNPKLEFNRKFILMKILMEYNERIESFVLLSPEERYLSYIKDHPKMTNRVSDKYIANILGVTPVSLSRIRKRIFEKE